MRGSEANLASEPFSFSVSTTQRRIIMAKHKKHGGRHGRHKKGLKIHGGFKSMEHKKGRRKK
jgi:hypothetical protein